MARAKLIFYGAEGSSTETYELECMSNHKQEIYISIESGDYPGTYICLDKPTAIKFVKTLKSEINKIGGHDE